MNLPSAQLTATNANHRASNGALGDRMYYLEPESNWPAPIPVSERLPELLPDRNVSDPVLAFSTKRQEWHVGRLTAVNSFFGAPPVWAFDHRPIETDRITHWLPLPPTP